MPINPYTEQKNCFKHIDKIMNSIGEEGIVFKEILRQCLILYSVSRTAVVKFIEECYLETNYFYKQEGKLFKNEEVKK